MTTPVLRWRFRLGPLRARRGERLVYTAQAGTGGFFAMLAGMIRDRVADPLAELVEASEDAGLYSDEVSETRLRRVADTEGER